MERGIGNIIGASTPVWEKYAGQVLFAYLFGSSAGSDCGPLSDMDIAVYFAAYGGPDRFENGLALHADLCRALKRDDIDLVVLNGASNIMLVEEIVRRGIVLRDEAPDVREDFELAALHRAIDFRTHRRAVMGL